VPCGAQKAGRKREVIERMAAEKVVENFIVSSVPLSTKVE